MFPHLILNYTIVMIATDLNHRDNKDTYIGINDNRKCDPLMRKLATITTKISWAGKIKEFLRAEKYSGQTKIIKNNNNNYY